MHQNNRFKISVQLFCFITLAFSFTMPIQAQETFANIHAKPTNERILLDGNLSEDIWNDLIKINEFVQREPDLGKPTTEKTEVAITYDENNLYIGIWCYQDDPETIVAKFMHRDFHEWSVDNFKVMISPFNDNKSGYIFIINPLGARTDAQIINMEHENRSWNGVWDVRTKINDKGWFAEIMIPFSTFQFKKVEKQLWAINFERNIKSKNEEATWQGWSRDHSINSVSEAGKLIGINNLEYTKKFEFKPYLLTGFEDNTYEKKANYPFKYGGDLNINISPTLKLNLTTNTDFAQVEVDRIAVNLTRFDLYYPEKREFFLENSSQFSFNFGRHADVFYTRRIGIENDDTPVDILGGVRLVGKINRHNIGFLSIQTEEVGDVPSSNNTVFRYKADIGSQSYVGGIVTSKINENSSNQVFGIDAKFSTSKFLKNKNLIVYGNLARSFTKDLSPKNPYAFRVFVDYPNDQLDIYIGASAIYKDFDPQLGFLPRENYENFIWSFRLMPRIKNNLGIRKFQFIPWRFFVYRKSDSKEIESFRNTTRLLGFDLNSGDQFELNFKQEYDNLDEAFDLIEDEVVIPIDEYWMNVTEIKFETYEARRIWAEVGFSWGEFYTGKMKKLDIECGLNINRNLNITTYFTYNNLDLPQGVVITKELSSTINYAVNPRLNFSLFSQYNSLEEILFFNFKMHWIPKIGSEFYIVYNRGYEEIKSSLEFLKPSVSSGVVKIVWRFTF